MKRTMAAIMAVTALVVLAAGVAWAATVECDPGVFFCDGTDRPDELVGTNKPDLMDAKQDDDRLLGFRGGDFMLGDNAETLEDSVTDGDDELFANDGVDFLLGFGGFRPAPRRRQGRRHPC